MLRILLFILVVIFISPISFSNINNRMLLVNKYENESKVYDNQLKKDPDDINANFNKAYSLFQSAKNIFLINKVDSGFLKYVESIVSFSDSTYRNRLVDSIKYFDKVIKLNNKMHKAYAYKAIAQVFLDHYVESKKNIYIAVSLSRKDADFYLNEYANSLIKKDKYSDAIVVLDDSIKNNPSNEITYLLKAISFRKLGDINKSNSMFLKAKEINPKNYEIAKQFCISKIKEK